MGLRTYCHDEARRRPAQCPPSGRPTAFTARHHDRHIPTNPRTVVRPHKTPTTDKQKREKHKKKNVKSGTAQQRASGPQKHGPATKLQQRSRQTSPTPLRSKAEIQPCPVLECTSERGWWGYTPTATTKHDGGPPSVRPAVVRPRSQPDTMTATSPPTHARLCRRIRHPPPTSKRERNIQRRLSRVARHNSARQGPRHMAPQQSCSSNHDNLRRPPSIQKLKFKRALC